MPTRLLSLAALVFPILATLMLATPVLAADLYRHTSTPVYGSIPACDAADVLANVRHKSAYRGQAPYQQPVAIAAFDQIGQTRFVASAGPGLRERRWCQARAHLAGGRTHTVYYLIEEHASFAGVAYGVESCLSGRDLWNVHGGDCSALRIW